MPAESTGLGMAELEAEYVELLPERAAMGLFNFADIWATSQSWAFTNYSAFSYNSANSVQVVLVGQK